MESENDRKAGVYVSLRDRGRNGKSQGHCVLRYLRPKRALELLDEAEEAEHVRHLTAGQATPATELSPAGH